MANEKQPERKLEWLEQSESVPDIYTNITHLSWTLYDVRVQLGALVASPGPDPTAGIKVERRGSVTLSWPAAKALVAQLSKLVASYESVNGEIPRLKLAPASDGQAEEQAPPGPSKSIN